MAALIPRSSIQRNPTTLRRVVTGSQDWSKERRPTARRAAVAAGRSHHATSLKYSTSSSNSGGNSGNQGNARALVSNSEESEFEDSGPSHQIHKIFAVSTASGAVNLRQLQERLSSEVGLVSIFPPSQRPKLLYAVVDSESQSKSVMAPPFALNNAAYAKTYFWFEDGTIVCWGASEEDFKSVLAFTGGFAGAERFHEKLQFKVSAYGAYDMNRDLIHLSSDTSIGEMLAFSHGIARSVKLDALEAITENAISEVGKINEFFLRGGKVKWFDPEYSDEKLNKKIGKIMKLRWDLNVKTDIGETPEYLWEEAPKHEKLYDQIERALDIKARVAAINKKLKIADEDLEILGHYLHTSKGASMEKMIVYLLIIEVTSLLLEKWGFWHHFRWEWFFGDLLGLSPSVPDVAPQLQTVAQAKAEVASLAAKK